MDTHFEAARPEYEAMLRSRPPAGVARARRRVRRRELPAPHRRGGRSHRARHRPRPGPGECRDGRSAARRLESPLPVVGQVGSLLALPFPDAQFDAVWCAAVTQYLTDDELATALRELVRVTKPGRAGRRQGGRHRSRTSAPATPGCSGDSSSPPASGIRTSAACCAARPGPLAGAGRAGGGVAAPHPRSGGRRCARPNAPSTARPSPGTRASPRARRSRRTIGPLAGAAQPGRSRPSDQ